MPRLNDQSGRNISTLNFQCSAKPLRILFVILCMSTSPLAERIRPNTLDELAGQEHLTGKGSILRTAIDQGKVPSMILWGPPGVGKTTIANIIAHTLASPFYTLSAISSGVKEVREVIEQAKTQEKVILFIDEIHRFNKGQQDAFLGAVEKGIITLIGATTENPSFEVNSALLSRCQVYVLKPLDEDDLSRLIDIAQQRIAIYDKSGEQHYDIISAFIKSIRGSDPNGAIYWLARMIEGGEDVKFIARRMVILASEDIGNANPTALVLANSCFEAVNKIGYPEARIILAQCATYLAASNKSNASYMAIETALSLVRSKGDLPVPLHIRNAPTKLMKNLDYGKNYKYSHSFDNNFSDQEYLPDALSGTTFYEPGKNPREEELRKYLKALWKDKYGY